MNNLKVRDLIPFVLLAVCACDKPSVPNLQEQKAAQSSRQGFVVCDTTVSEKQDTIVISFAKQNNR